MSSSDYTIFLIMIVIISDYVIVTQNLAVLWTKKNMSVYTLLPDPSSLAVFNNVCAFFKKTGLSTDRRYCEHKQTMAT